MARLPFDNKAWNPPAPKQSFEPLPDGNYVALIEESDVKTNRAGDGTYLNLRWTVIQGDYTGRKVFQNITLTHTNEKWQARGEEDLQRLCGCLGMAAWPQDSKQLHEIPCLISVFIREQEGYKPDNKVRDYAPAPDTPGVNQYRQDTSKFNDDDIPF